MQSSEGTPVGVVEEHREYPTAEYIAKLPPFQALAAGGIVLVDSAKAADAAMLAIDAAAVAGFDTESKPTFVAGAPQTGPHLVQLAVRELGFCFPTESKWARQVLEHALTSDRLRKVGFGVSNDRAPLAARFDIRLRDALDLSSVIRRMGYRQRVGLRAAVAIVLGQRLVKSKSVQKSNWSRRPLTVSQLVYAANDAYAALRVHEALCESHPQLF